MVLTRPMLERERLINEVISSSGSETPETDTEQMKDEIERLKRELEYERRKQSSPDRSRSQAQKIRRLEKQHEVDKLRIKSYKKQLKAKELEADAEELVGDDASSSRSPAHSDLMRRLLCRFCDLMVVPTMESEESQCPICREIRSVTEFLSFPCEHYVCNKCLPSLPLVQGKFSCHTCRRLSSYEEHERVIFTEVGRWDALLEVAKDWAKVDTKDADKSTEDRIMEDEGNITDDIRCNVVDAESEEGTSQEHQGNPETQAVTPPPKPTKYSQLSSQEKKRRMEDIVQKRVQKRR